MQKHCKLLNQKTPNGQKVHLSSSSDELRVMMVFAQKKNSSTAAFYAQANHFFTTLKSPKVLETSHSRTMASFAMPFPSLVCMHAYKCNRNSRLLN